MNVYIVECYDSVCDGTYIMRVCERRDVAEYFVKRFRHIDNSNLPSHMQDHYYSYGIKEHILIK